MAEPVIRAENVVKRYGSAEALRDVSLDVNEGELFGLVGPDGAGKTTFLRLLACLLAPSAGRLSVGGVDTEAAPAEVKRQIGYMSQRFSLSGTLTVLENLQYVAEIWGVPPQAQRQRIERLLAFSRLGPFQDRLARDLSGGMKQKLSLATCLIHRPRVLLLDEPTIGVDPLSRRDFWLILYDLLQEGSTILLSTPYMDEAERCRRVGFLLDGRLVVCGPPAELKAGLGSKVLELRCAAPRDAERTLRQLPGLEAPVMFGERIHVALPDPGHAPAHVERARRAGIEIRDWSIREPSLEDVFLSYARGAAAATEPRGPLGP